MKRAVVVAVALVGSYACGGGTDFQTAVLDGGVDAELPRTDGHSVDARKDTGGHDGAARDTGKQGDVAPPGDTGTDAGSGDGGGHADAGGHDGAPGCGTEVAACSASVPCAASKFPQCQTLECQNDCCAAVNAAAGATCNDQGKVCDGSGSCVACVMNTDCPATMTACALATCSGHACVVTSAAIDTECSDHGGQLCNGAGQCVMCTSMNKTACTGSTPYCGTAGRCVQCLTTADCANTLETCNDGSCVVGL